MSNFRKNNARKVMTTSAAAALAATAIAPAVASADDHTFSDVQTDHPYFDQIETLAAAGVVQGDENGNFNPEDYMSRASAAEMLAKALDLQPEGENPFPDVSDEHWAADSITALYEAGVVQGDEDGHFNPSNDLSRAAIAEMVVKGYGLELDEASEVTFDDVDEGEWYANNVHILASHGLVTGNGEGQYFPENDMQRQHFAKLVATAMDQYGEEEELAVESVSSINHQQVRVVFNQELTEGVDASDFDIDNGITVRDAEVDSSNPNIVYLTTTSQTTGYEYTVSYEGAEVGSYILQGNTGSYNDDIEIQETDSVLKQISTAESSDDDNIDRGKRQYTVNVSGLTGQVDIALVPASYITQNEDGQPVFINDSDDNLRVHLKQFENAELQSTIEEVNGVDHFNSYADGIDVPSDDELTFTVDNQDQAETVVPVVFQDANSDDHLSVDRDGVPTEAVGIGGALAFYSEEADFGNYEDVQTLQGYTATHFPEHNAFIDTEGRLFSYDSEDEYQLEGIGISEDEFHSLLTPSDVLDVSYREDGVSTFNFIEEYGSEAPTAVEALVADNNVHLEWNNGNINNEGSSYIVERAPSVGPDGIGNTSDDVTSDFQWEEVGTTNLTWFTDENVADGQYVYRIKVENEVTNDVDVSGEDLSDSGVAGHVQVPQETTNETPVVEQFTAIDQGLTGEVDTGDTWNILFSENMDLQDGDLIRASELNDGAEYSNIVLGEGNTFETTEDPTGRTLLTIEFTETPNIDGYNNYIGTDEPQRNEILEYEELAITNSDGVESAAGLTLAATLNSPSSFSHNLHGDAPAVSNITTNANKQFTITFDQAVDLESAGNADNYLVTTDGDTNEVTRVDVTSWNTVDVYTLNDLGTNSTLDQTVADVDGVEADETTPITGDGSTGGDNGDGDDNGETQTFEITSADGSYANDLAASLGVGTLTLEGTVADEDVDTIDSVDVLLTGEGLEADQELAETVNVSEGEFSEDVPGYNDEIHETVKVSYTNEAGEEVITETTINFVE
ncbi:hypothetical protein ABID56_002340 [Alkalibacillus flavidus]|uniref:SLH domain-containing protein n=1 Tax=Alkalibacillus flavidus TaxID=546021 RepID=A0ABV2KX98_9BACI